MERLVAFLGCGRIVQELDHSKVHFIVNKFTDITDKIIHFFSKYQVVGIKYDNFKDWCKVAEIMQNKGHLTEEGFNKILKIKAGMNKGRI